MTLSADRRLTLRIARHPAGCTTTLCLIGHLRSEHLAEVHEQMRGGGTQTVLDLAEVTLVDADAVRFLGYCEMDGVRLLHCPPYVREWIHRERQ